MDKFRELVSTLSNLKDYCDIIRIVDPIKMQIVDINNGHVQYTERKCYEFWNRNKSCDNCIAMRALNENNTFMKIEYHENRVYSITASPFEIDGNIFIVEILKDITDTGMVLSRGKADNFELLNIITEMNRLAITDELTGIFNRRYINEKLPIEFLENNTPARYVSLIMGDIDYFKRVNDTYGHLAGDYVLKEFASILSEAINEVGGWTGRYGGEEFLAVVYSNDEKVVYDTAERIRRNIEKHNFVYQGKNIRITASFGVYILNNINKNFISVIDKVDKNLYVAKETGRNKVVLSIE